MDKAELQKLLETPLDPNLDYFDATASIEAIADHIRNQHKLINFLMETLARQGQSIIDLREQQVEVRGDLLAAGIERKGEEPLIIMPDKPKLEIN